MPDVEWPVDAPSRVARFLRHEMGDLLQGIYSASAILLGRLPEEFTLERQIIADLKRRTEQVKIEMDAVVRLTGTSLPATLPLDLTVTVRGILSRFRQIDTHMAVTCSLGEAIAILSDPVVLPDSLLLLLLGLSQGARSLHIVLQAEPVPCCRIMREGTHLADEHFLWLQKPFATPRGSLLGLGFASCAQLLGAGGGSIQATNNGSTAEIHLVFAPAAAMGVS